ncbi:MAG: hypothetical protein HYU75_02460, partial [Betaproteobacteria bacterium]|nr:hypothetical protein [Betaproteobacteria bacterium]
GASGAKAVIVNDAGIGKDDAGTSGLSALEPLGMAAATVDYRSARIGDGRDTLAAGRISRVNRWAAQAGVLPGEEAAIAAERLARWEAPAERVRAQTPAEREALILAPGRPRLVAIDSASMIGPEFAGDAVVTGSHGGVVTYTGAAAGRGVKAAVAAAFFNDAGVGKDRAGIGRLLLLERDRIPGATVGCMSARIGDALDAYQSGVLSHVNAAARDLGLAPGQRLREALRELIARLKER